MDGRKIITGTERFCRDRPAWRSNDDETGDKPMTSVLWIVCPPFHDSAAFLELRRGIVRHLSPWSLGPRREVRFVVVDNTGHQDPEITLLEDVDDVKIVHAPFNLGHQGALVFGLRALAPQIAAADRVVTMDADDEDKPADLPQLLGVLCRQPPGSLDVVLAHRTKRHESWASTCRRFSCPASGVAGR